MPGVQRFSAGITTFNSLRHSEAVAGDLIAVQGLGGLGHLGIQFASRMGYRTVGIGRGKDKESLALELLVPSDTWTPMQ